MVVPSHTYYVSQSQVYSCRSLVHFDFPEVAPFRIEFFPAAVHSLRATENQ